VHGSGRTVGAPRPAVVLLVAAALVGGVVLTSSPSSASPGAASASAQASALAAQVSVLESRTEVATEQYDAVASRLAVVVTESLQASERLDALNSKSTESQDQATNRISAIYMAGGGLSLYATVLDGTSPGDVMTRMHAVQSLMGEDHSQVDALRHAVTNATRTQDRLLALSRERTSLEKQAQASRNQVYALLASRQQALDAANATVLRLVAQEQARQQAAAEAAARAALAGSAFVVGDTSQSGPYAAAAIAAATTKLGVPYVWGAAGPDTFDCSGLVQWAYGQAGLSLARVAADQYRSGPEVQLNALAPGDLLFWATDPALKSTIHHVAIYVGQGQMIEAPHTGAYVRLVPIRLGPEFAGAVRPEPASAAAAPTPSASTA